MKKKTSAPAKPTPALIKGLTIIRDSKALYMPSQFAKLFWGSDHPGWQRHGKAGVNGAATGVGMRLAGGALLGKWERWGLISSPMRSWEFSAHNRYKLTDKGKAYLESAKEGE